MTIHKEPAPSAQPEKSTYFDPYRARPIAGYARDHAADQASVAVADIQEILSIYPSSCAWPRAERYLRETFHSYLLDIEDVRRGYEINRNSHE
jgi:hypothetical protein